MDDGAVGIGFLGHSTVAVELDGVRILTDPLLRRRIAHLYRFGPRPDPGIFERIDAVLISHLHLDHLDLPSLRRLGRETRVIVPHGAGALLRRRRFQNVVELNPGDAVDVGPVTVHGTFAAHSGFRPPIGPSAPPLGFLIEGTRRVYFAGDTGLFPEMVDLGQDLDLALLPVWGWGPNLDETHLNPERAAEALTLLRPSVAVPIHWGAFAVPGLVTRDSPFFTRPPELFSEYAARLAPEVSVHIIPPGERARIFA
jgi:L-ascorbate metabolism protein UlaG (beta-lactamase superfamily)